MVMDKITTLDGMLLVLNAACGDVLKANVLNQLAGLSINPMLLRAPSGTVEQAFAEARAKMVEDEPRPKRAETALAAFKADHTKPAPVETLPKMPAEIRFEDLASPSNVVAITAPPVPESQDQAQYISLKDAAALRGCGSAAIYAAAKSQGWKRIADPADGRKSLYLKSDVLAGQSRRRAA